ncbi:MAG: caspase family protein [Calditrichaeota bacterium]|nr:MAG: caspase family protein [Calditrichota bacterium]
MAKKALLVGINRYQRSEWNLRGCLNDVFDIYNLLTNTFDFNPKEIRVLSNERATQKNILHRLKKMVEEASDGDTLVFYYSGHGSRVLDRDGDERLRDNMDEVLVVHDHNWDDPLTDDKLARILDNLPEDVNMYVLFDCCHSGTATRSLSNKRKTSVRYVNPPFDIQMRSFKYKPPRRGLIDILIDLKKLIFGEDIDDNQDLNHILLSASKDNESSLETDINGKQRGVFTYFLTNLLREKEYQDAPLVDIYDTLVKRIHSYGYTQSPQLEGLGSLKREPIFS